jgi:transposase
VRILIAKGANEHLVNRFNHSALSLAYDQSNNRNLNLKKHQEILQILENSDSYRTPEVRACIKRQKDVASSSNQDWRREASRQTLQQVSARLRIQFRDREI